MFGSSHVFSITFNFKFNDKEEQIILRFFFLLLLNYDYKTSPIYKFWFYKIIVTYRSKKFKFHLRAFWLFFKPVWHSEDNIKLFIKIISPSRYVIKRKRSGWFHISKFIEIIFWILRILRLIIFRILRRSSSFGITLWVGCFWYCPLAARWG